MCNRGTSYPSRKNEGDKRLFPKIYYLVYYNVDEYNKKGSNKTGIS